MSGVTVADLVRQAAAIEMTAEALMLHARVFRAQVQAALTDAREADTEVAQDKAPVAKPEASQGGTDPSAPIECRCPANRRRVAPAEGHPSRTKCNLCGRMHD